MDIRIDKFSENLGISFSVLAVKPQGGKDLYSIKLLEVAIVILYFPNSLKLLGTTRNCFDNGSPYSLANIIKMNFVVE